MELTEFVGRRVDRANVRRLISESRLFTLTGVGGVGKTRLALRIAAESQRAMRDGVFFVPLAELSDPALIVEATAAALGIHDRSTEFGHVAGRGRHPLALHGDARCASGADAVAPRM